MVPDLASAAWPQKNRRFDGRLEFFFLLFHVRSLSVCLLAFLIDSPVFRDRQTWTSEGTAGNVYGLSLRWSFKVLR